VNFRDYVDRLCAMVQQVSETLPLLQDYGILFKREKRVQSSLVQVYLNILKFCVTARDVFAVQENAGRKCKLLYPKRKFLLKKKKKEKNLPAHDLCRAPSNNARSSHQSALAEL
jgi:hypothetical protein